MIVHVNMLVLFSPFFFFASRHLRNRRRPLYAVLIKILSGLLTYDTLCQIWRHIERHLKHIWPKRESQLVRLLLLTRTTGHIVMRLSVSSM